MKTKLLLLLLLANFSIYAQYTAIPDANFEKKLIALGIDSGTADGQVLTSKVSGVTSLDVSRYSIADLTGIQDFTSLTKLDCSGNTLTSINLSKNVNLSILYIYSNQLASLDISNNTGLNELSAGSNQLTSIDFSKNTSLTLIGLSKNKLTGVDVSFLPSLITLSAEQNNLQNINVTNNSTLENLYVTSTGLTTLDISQNTALKSLDCDKNALTTLDLSHNSLLRYLRCSSTKVTSLDLSSNPLLESIIVTDNLLTSLNVSNNPLIWEFWCQRNKLTTIDVSSVTALKTFVCSDNLIETFDVRSNAKLSSLSCGQKTLKSVDVTQNPLLTFLSIDQSSQLTSVDISQNPLLNHIDSDDTGLSSIDLSHNLLLADISINSPALKELDLSKNTALTSFRSNNGNALGSLNLKNGNNLKLQYLSFTANASLDCVQVDDADYANANWSAFKPAKASFSTDCNAIPYTLIPDLNFEKKLISLGIDFGAPDGKVKTSRIENVTSLDVSWSSIADLTGIQDFKSLTYLNCYVNSITSLDLSHNTKLEELYAPSTLLTSLNVSNNTSLTTLTCSNGKLTTVDLSALTALKKLDIRNNALTALDVSGNTQLVNLYCGNNQLTALDLSANTSLKEIMVDSNKLAVLNVSKNPELTAIDAKNNQLATFDISTNSKLVKLNLRNNLLTSLNLKNGFNTNLTLTDTDFRINTGLKCIQVDDVTYSDANWANIKDVNAKYNLDCTAYTLIPDANFEQKLIDLGIDKDGKNGKVLTASIAVVKDLNVQFSEIADLTGIEDFTSLEFLNCQYNNLTSLNLSKNLNLIELYCHENLLTVLDVAVNSNLTTLQVNKNKIKSLDLSKNKKLVSLNTSENDLNYLNLQNGNNTAFTSVVMLKNPKLTCILVDDTSYAITNWSTGKDVSASFNVDCTPYTLIPDANFEQKLINLGIDNDGKNGKVKTASIASVTTLDISSSAIANLTGIQDFESLTTLNFNTNSIASYNPANNPLLTELRAAYNVLTSLDISKNPALLYIDFSNNNLSSLNLKNGQNTKLNWFSVNFTKNPSLSCIQVDDVTYSNDNWNGKLDKTSFFAVDCSSFTLIPDTNFEQALIDLKIDIDGKNGKVLTSSVAVVKDLNVELNEIADLTGIEAFASLEFLNCQFNNLTSLNLSKNSNLIELYCHGNLLTALDVSANKNLTTLQANKNKIKSLDISKNTSLVYINASENALETLNLKNGNNINFTTAFMFKNTSLTCIKVDNPAFASTSDVFYKDANASYSDSCSLGLEDSVFNHVVLYPNPTKGEVTIDNVSLEKATVYNSLGQLVKSFTLDTANSSNTIDLSGLPKGIYYVYLINQDASSAKKIIVE